MKITELDLQAEDKRYKCGNSIFKVKDGDLLEVETDTYLKDLCIPISELLEMDFEEIKETKNPYTRVDDRNRNLYYAIEREGYITSIADDSEYDNHMFNIANYFNNKEYAEYIAFKETLMRKLDKFAWEHNAKVIDWDDNFTKYYIAFDINIKELRISWRISYKSNDIYFTSQEIAEMALEKFKDDLIKLYTWEFDV